MNGAPVLGIETTRTIGDWKNICQRLLGFVPSLRDFSSSFLKVSALKARMLSEPQLSDMATQEIVNQKVRCYMFWMIAGTMADTSGSYLKLMYLSMLEDVNTIGFYSWGSATFAYLYRFLYKASQSIQNEIVEFLPLLQVWAWERITVLRPQIVGKRSTEDIFPTDLHKGPHATRWFAHFSWTNTTKYVLKVYRDALDSMTKDQFIWEPYTDDLIESLPDYCHAGRDMWHIRVPIFCWDVVEVHLPDRVTRQFRLQQVIPTSFLFDSTHFLHDCRGRPNTNWELEHAQWLPFWNEREQYICNAPVNHGPLRYDDPYLIWFRRITHLIIGNPNPHPQCQQGYVPNSTAYETMARHIHSMVDKSKSLGDTPSLGKGDVVGRRECVIARDQVPVEMNEMDKATQNAQISSEDDQAITNHDFGSTSMGCTQEFIQASGLTYQHTEIVPYMTPQTPQISRYPSLSSLDNIFGSYQPQHFENVPNFTSSLMPMSIDILDATNNLENLNTKMKDNKLDDSNNEVNGNDPKDKSKGCDTTIQQDELSKKEKHTIIAKLCGTSIFS
ncbi:hypothetical protein FXO38_35314 [Capsicum annuum]|nr:hypothetical protein FXO38_35314 [Capsicum annuum]